MQSKSKSKYTWKNNVNKKTGPVNKSKSKPKTREYSCILKRNKDKI